MIERKTGVAEKPLVADCLVRKEDGPPKKVWSARNPLRANRHRKIIRSKRSVIRHPHGIEPVRVLAPAEYALQHNIGILGQLSQKISPCPSQSHGVPHFVHLG